MNKNSFDRQTYLHHCCREFDTKNHVQLFCTYCIEELIDFVGAKTNFITKNILQHCHHHHHHHCLLLSSTIYHAKCQTRSTTTRDSYNQSLEHVFGVIVLTAVGDGMIHWSDAMLFGAASCTMRKSWACQRRASRVTFLGKWANTGPDLPEIAAAVERLLVIVNAPFASSVSSRGQEWTIL